MDKLLADYIITHIEDLCLNKILPSEKNQIIDDLCLKANINNATQLGRRQFNEILLLCKETRVTEEFFKYFTADTGTFKPGDFPRLIERLKKHSMLQYGNFRFALKKLIKSKNIDADLGIWVKSPNEIIEEFENRPEPIMEIQKISRKLVSHLGYLIKEKDIDVLEGGIFNTKVYLTSDYLDVYVATSMREEIDFHNVFDLCEGVFSSTKIKKLNLRYFDPTQSYHQNRIAKGLIEGLMLKRAKCTIYAAQESDSFGKDSELAATLAQGKPVIAYIPKYDPNDWRRLEGLVNLPLIKLLDKAEIYQNKAPQKIWRRYYAPFMDAVEGYLRKAEKAIKKGKLEAIVPEDQFKESLIINEKKFKDIICFIAKAEADFYDARADILKTIHPLGLQINLESGAANGVLIARSYKECVELLYAILTNQLEFEIIKPGEKKEGEYPRDDLNYLLCEKISKCAFRVVIKDELLTNSFWNFYLEQEK